MNQFEARELLSTSMPFVGPLQYPNLPLPNAVKLTAPLKIEYAAATAPMHSVPSSNKLPFVGPLQRPSGVGPLVSPPVVTTADEWYGTDKTNPTQWSIDDNWSLGHYPDHNANKTEESAVFDGAYNNPCVVDTAAIFPIVNMQVRNSYTSQITIVPHVVVETSLGFTFGVAGDGSITNIAFQDISCELIADGGSSSFGTEFHFTQKRGIVSIRSGASLTLANTAASDTTADFYVSGTLSVINKPVITFNGNAGINVFNGGGMTISGAVPKPLANAAGSTGFISIGSASTFLFSGQANSKTEIDMPMLNNGTATFDGGGLVQGQPRGEFFINASNLNTNNFAYDMQSGKTILQDGITLDALNGYYQSGGQSSLADTTIANINPKGPVQSVVEIDGGNVQLGPANAFGQLQVTNGGNLTLNGGEYDAKINGAVKGAGNCDVITVAGVVTIKGASKLVVSSPGAGVTPGLNWPIMTSVGAPVGDFAAANKKFPAAGMSSGWVGGTYNVNS